MASPYYLINRRGGAAMNYYVYHTDDNVIHNILATGGSGGFLNKNAGYFNLTFAATIPGGKGSISNGTTVTVNGDRGSEQFFVERALLLGPWTASTGDHLIITPSNDPRSVVVVLENATQKLRASLGIGSDPAEQQLDFTVEQTLLAVGTALLNAFATAFSALGPAGSVAAGASSLMAALIATGVSDAEPPPPPPTVAQIQAAVKDVVQEQEALKAATVFGGTLDWFSGYQRLVGPRSKPQPVTQQKYDDFAQTLHDALDQTKLDSFANQLAYVQSQPGIARYILPNFIAAIGVYLQLRRIRMGLTYLPPGLAKQQDHTLPTSEIDDLIADVTGLKSGLEHAVVAFKQARDALVAASGLAGTPEAIFPIKIATEHYLGDPWAARDDGYAQTFPAGSAVTPGGEGYGAHPDAVDAAVKELASTLTNLAAERTAIANGQSPKYLFKYDL